MRGVCTGGRHRGCCKIRECCSLTLVRLLQVRRARPGSGHVRQLSLDIGEEWEKVNTLQSPLSAATSQGTHLSYLSFLFH